MSRLALVLLLSLPRLVAAQLTEAKLEHRITALQARAEELHRRVARRDSLAIAGADLVVIGKAPIYLKVPAWAAPLAAPHVEAIVDSWTVRVGPLFTHGAADTVTVMFRTDTAGWTRRQIRELADVYPDVIAFNARRASGWRVERQFGMGFIQWLGPDLPAPIPAKDRRDAIVALAADTTGIGRRCLEGDGVACITALERPTERSAPVRRALLGAVLDRAGAAGWSGLAVDTTATGPARIAAIGAEPYAQLVARWLADVRHPDGSGSSDFAGASLLALAWGGALLLVFLWRLTWHRG
jgi:hypothetical protein